MRLPLLLAALVTRASLAGAGDPLASAEKATETWATRATAFGDFAGWRPALADHGVDCGLAYFHEYLGVVDGGVRRRGEYNGVVQLDFDIELEKALGWQGASLHATAFAGWGQSISGLWIGDDSNVSNINMRNGVRLFEAWVEQAFGDGLSLRAGLLASDSEFYSSAVDFTETEGGALFINSDFGAIPIVSLNVPGPLYPNAAPGVMLTARPSKSLVFRAAVYDGQALPSDPADDRNPHGLEPQLGSGDGALIVGEIDYDWNRPEERVPGSNERLKLGGCIRIGAFFHTGDFTHWKTGRARPGLGGGWISANEMLWLENGIDHQGLCAFARVSAAPRDRAVLEFCADGGFVYHGLLPGRDDDQAGVGVSFKRYSRDFHRTERAAGNPPRDHETIVEFTYRAQLAPWLALQPDAQLILNPAGDHTAGHALVIGLRVAMDF